MLQRAATIADLTVGVSSSHNWCCCVWVVLTATACLTYETLICCC